MEWDMTGHNHAVTPVNWQFWNLLRTAQTVTASPYTGRLRLSAHAETALLDPYAFALRSGLSPMRAYGRAKAIVECPSLASALAGQRQTRKRSRKPGMFPRPVYVATLADGSQLRATFTTDAGKSVDPAIGYNSAAILARGLPIDGYVELPDSRERDRFFAGIDGASVAIKPQRFTARDYQGLLRQIADAIADGAYEAAGTLAATGLRQP